MEPNRLYEHFDKRSFIFDDCTNEFFVQKIIRDARKAYGINYPVRVYLSEKGFDIESYTKDFAPSKMAVSRDENDSSICEFVLAVDRKDTRAVRDALFSGMEYSLRLYRK